MPDPGDYHLSSPEQSFIDPPPYPFVLSKGGLRRPPLDPRPHAGVNPSFGQPVAYGLTAVATACRRGKGAARRVAPLTRASGGWGCDDAGPAHSNGLRSRCGIHSRRERGGFRGARRSALPETTGRARAEFTSVSARSSGAVRRGGATPPQPASYGLRERRDLLPTRARGVWGVRRRTPQLKRRPYSVSSSSVFSSFSRTSSTRKRGVLRAGSMRSVLALSSVPPTSTPRLKRPADTA